MHAVCSSRGAECRVALAGRVTIDSSPELHALLRERLESTRCQELAVDFYDVIYIDTSGLAVLVEILKIARTQRKVLSISGLRGRPRYLLEATRLLHLFRETDRDPASLKDSVEGNSV